MDNLNKTIDTFYELQLKLKEHDKKELKSSSWKSFVIAFRESLAPSKPQTQFKPQQLPSKNPPQLHHKKDSPKKVEPTSPPKPNIKAITHDTINKPKQQQLKPLIQPQLSIKKDLPNKSPHKPLNEYNPDRTPDAIDSCGSFGNDGDVSPELKPCDKLSPVHNSNNNSNNINKVNKDNLYLVNSNSNSNSNNKIKNGIEVHKTIVRIPLSIFGNSNIKYKEDLEQYINKERSRENSQNQKHYNSNTKQHVSGNSSSSSNIKQTITSPNHNNYNTSLSSSMINKNNSNIKRSLPLHHHTIPLKQSKPLTNSTNNNISSSLTTLQQQPKKDHLKTYLDIFDKSISKLKNEYNEKAHHIQNPTRLNPITSTFKDISTLQSKNKSLLESSSSSSTDKQHKEQSIIYNTLSILKLICTVFETVDKCELLFNKNKEIFSSLIDVLKYIKSKYKENNINKPLWLNQSKLIVKFIMSLILLKSYTHSKLKELISNDNSNKMKNMIEFIKVYDSYSKTVVDIRNYYTNTIEEIKDNNKNKKILIESVVEYLKKEPNAMKYKTCFSLAKKIIDITLDSNTISTNNNN